MDANTLIAPGGRARVEGTHEVGALVLGRHRLLERLGAGGFGVVWRAHDTLLDREVAVKVIPLADGDRARATREALAAARLAHPAIVALYEACVEDDTCYLISELVHGATLAELLAAQALGDEQVLEIGCTLCDALLHAHRRGVVHRDVKPHNVLVGLGPDGRSRPLHGSAAAEDDPTRAHPPQERAASAAPLAKLTDFGGALVAGEDGLTRTGDVLGTLAYMAPEQIDGAEVDERADLYSLALVLYEALSGVNPVRGPTPAATARRIGCELAPLERHRRDLPRALTRALDRALDPDPRERGSLPELRDALVHTLDGGPRRPRWQRHAGAAPTAAGRPPQAGPKGPAQSLSPLPLRAPATVECPPEHAGEWAERSAAEPDAGGWLTLARAGWLAGTLAVCVWLLTAGRPGIAAAALCAVAPLVVAVRRPGPRWVAPALAPALGVVGLATAWPALAGQSARWRSRALAGALGYWWLRLAAPLLERPSHAAGVRWLAALPSVGLLLGVALWGLTAALLPWLVRGHSAVADATTAALWAALLAAGVLGAGPLLHRGLSIPHASPRDVVLGAALGAALAVLARALRGPV